MENETSEIAKLTERISKDPKSKLFVPLAEEYKKIGDIEMAMYVLAEGLKNNPGYVTARSFLGKLLLEKGDLAGANKEFEDVVKAVPDNLMAQRKLGDIYIFLNNPEEGLKHYRIALSLNPKDEEFAALIKEVESGHDIRSKLPSSKVILATPQVGKKEQPPAVPAPEAVKPSVQVKPQETSTPSDVPAPPAPVPQSKTSLWPDAPIADAPMPEEEAEEVLVVESLDEEAAIAVAAEKATAADQMETAISPESSVGLAPLIENEVLASTADEEVFVIAEETIQSEVTSAALDSAFDEFSAPAEEMAETAPEPIVSAGPAETIDRELDMLVDVQVMDSTELSSVEPPQVSEKREKKAAEGSGQEHSDDFTTDTLAELYIAQGFYEKAIDIYERMFADNPGSQGLKDKLARVKAVAAQSAEPTIEGTPVSESIREPAGADRVIDEKEAIFDEPLLAEEVLEEQPVVAAEADSAERVTREAREYVPPPADTETNSLAEDIFVIPGEAEPVSVVPESNIFAEPGEYQPSPTDGQLPQDLQAGPSVFDASVIKEPRAMPAYVDVEAREYVPPKPEAAPEKEKPEAVNAAPKQRPTGSRRKVTIERLESWLSNIKKES